MEVVLVSVFGIGSFFLVFFRDFLWIEFVVLGGVFLVDFLGLWFYFVLDDVVCFFEIWSFIVWFLSFYN